MTSALAFRRRPPDSGAPSVFGYSFRLLAPLIGYTGSDGDGVLADSGGSVTDRGTVLDVSGEIDLASAPALRTRLSQACLENEGQVIVLDFSGLEFIDSTGLGVLVAALRRQRDRGGDLRLACIPKNVERVFTITGLDRVFELYANLDDAAAGLSASRGSSTDHAQG
jgi:anti-sigma B factor antagonist